MESLNKAEVLAKLPKEWPENLLPEIKKQVELSGVKIVVLDDDPTGNQTVHDVFVLTEWSIPTLCRVFSDSTPVVYILTNSRSLSLKEAQRLNCEIAQNLQATRFLSGRNFVVISRSDSTLRGHYPGEVDALTLTFDESFDGILVIPFFIEGGRLTIADTHYVTTGNNLIPAGETEYARDPVFGYKNSNLRAWVSEKTGGLIPPEKIASITLYDIRVGGPSAVARKLDAVSQGQVCIVNAVSYRDLEVFVAGLLQAERKGKRFLYRTAASFVRVRGGIQAHPLLSGVDLDIPAGGGLIIAGSFVEKTTRQLKAVYTLPHLQHIEMSIQAVLDPAQRNNETQRVTKAASTALKIGDDVLIYTSREFMESFEELKPLEIGRITSQALVSITANLEQRPAWIIAKGGITASDIATKGLFVQKGYVLGQILPGIPVWRTGKQCRWPGLTYIVFPGNVGDENALVHIIRTLRG